MNCNTNRSSTGFRRAPKPKDVGKGLVSFDELVANSVGELGEAFLGGLYGALGEQRTVEPV